MTTGLRKDGRDECGGKKRSGGICTQRAGWGTDHPGVGRCKLHGGSTPTHGRAAALELARRECVTLGLRVEGHPAEALLEEIYRSRANVYFFERPVMELPTHPTEDVKHVVDGGPNDGAVEWERGQPGVYGRTYHVTGLPTGEAKPHVLVVLYNEERKHLAAVVASALKLGLDAARVQIAQDQAALVAEAFRGLVIALGHDPAEPKVMEALGAHLRLLSRAA